MKKAVTIKEKVLANSETLKALGTSHTQLKEWAFAQGMDNKSAFPKFKNALLEIGLDYELIKTGLHTISAEVLESKITHKVTFYTDAKASAGKFGICGINGEVVWYGNFFPNENADEQSRAELAAAEKAVWLASKVKEVIGAEAIELELIVDAQWLTYQDHSKQKGYVLTQKCRKYGIKLNVTWIPGVSNPADKWTTASGYKKYQDNDLTALAIKIEKGAETAE